MPIRETYSRRPRAQALAIRAAQNSGQTTVRWGAIFAGTLTALLAYATLISLGMALGGDGLQSVVNGESSARSLGVGAGIWLVASVLVSLFAGGFVAGRVAGPIAARIGRVQGIVVAGLFFALMFSQAGAVLGSIGNGLGSVASGVARGVGSAAAGVVQSDEAQSLIGDAIGDLNLKSPPETVARGVAARLIRGRDDAALTYLSRQANITRAEAQARIETVKAQFDQVITQAGDAAARAVELAGWTLFGALFFGSLCALAGGGWGAGMSLRSLALSEDEERELAEAA